MQNLFAEGVESPTTEEICARARKLRDSGKGRTVSFSPKVFIPLTRLCRDFCGYCVFRQSPQEAGSPYMTPEEVLAVCRAGEEAGCREALFVLGERPEERYPEARSWLKDSGYDSTIEYLVQMCRLVLEETSLYPHSNPGTLTRSELASLRDVNVSMGLMLESSSERLHQVGGPHQHAPSKHPRVRLETLELAGQLGMPFTTGLLVGIGETPQERIEGLHAIQDLHQRFGHIQEVIIQNFCSKPKGAMKGADEASRREMLETTAMARVILGSEMNVQVPPNLNEDHLTYLEAGVNDWGGISPVTIDYVNPEAPWPHLIRMKEQMESRGYELVARFPLYPEFFLETSRFLPNSLLKRIRQEADGRGYFSGHPWSPARRDPLPPAIAPSSREAQS